MAQGRKFAIITPTHSVYILAIPQGVALRRVLPCATYLIIY
ncbi:hypothetical protein NT01EI_1750 [Edwardsiella ictaluri 93-146]|uniref:Uncharacterized protein n=1 Tax=Edwardsiella ictaluri (strain 93-146) TaxID=634503 RepID=C5BE09_EDWI9|nr:hypothetical protein NT01EI_1750 [Edwardsiella ictaluri 93-146]